jgi:arylsulfatase A-like enzyme
MTGLIPSQHGVHEPFNDGAWPSLPEDWQAISQFRTLPLTLKNRGYQTAMIGKWHLGQCAKPTIGYEYWVVYPKGHTSNFYNNTVIDNGKEYPVKDRHIVDFWAEKAAEYVDKYDGKKPFYLQVNFNGPYVMPPTNFGPDSLNPFYKEFSDQAFKPFNHHFSDKLMFQFTGPYDPDLPEEFSGDTKQILNAQNRMMFDYIRMHNDPQTRANIAAQNAMVDHGVGVILKALEASGLEEDTIVVYLSDHGMPFGHRGLWSGAPMTFPAVMYDQNFNIPLIMRHKGTIKTRSVSDMLVSEYDLMATILDYVGYPDIVIPNSPGRSFAPVLRGQSMEDWVQEVYFEHEESRAIRRPRYSYWKRHSLAGKNELYDLDVDPEANTDVYGRPEYADIAQQLDAKVSRFFARYADPQYDLWNGGTAKLVSYRIELWQKLYGANWKPTAELPSAFKE